MDMCLAEWGRGSGSGLRARWGVCGSRLSLTGVVGAAVAGLELEGFFKGDPNIAIGPRGGGEMSGWRSNGSDGQGRRGAIACRRG